MLRPIPGTLLTDTLVLYVCTGIDTYQNPTWDTTTVTRVHIQTSNETRKTTDNTEVVLRSILYIDGSQSQPALNYIALQKQSQAAGKPMRADVFNLQNQLIGSFEIMTVEALPDIPATRIHHYELGLV